MALKSSGESKISNLVLAIIDKVTSLISDHNKSNSAHTDIRNEVSNKISKSSTAGLVRNDGSIDITTYITTSDSRLSNARTPTSHSHGGITDGGALTSSASTVKNIVVTDSNDLIKVTGTIPINNIVQITNSRNNLADGIYIYEHD